MKTNNSMITKQYFNDTALNIKDLLVAVLQKILADFHLHQRSVERNGRHISIKFSGYCIK